MMELKYIIVCVCAFLAAAFAIQAEDLNLKVEANRDQIYLGESFILRVTVSGLGHGAEPDLSQIKNCRIEPLGSRDISNYSITIINGRTVKEGFVGRMMSYQVTPLCEGTIHAGPVRLTVKGQVLTAHGPFIAVKDIEKQDMVKIAISSSRGTILVDEPFDITLTVLLRCLKGQYAGIQPLYPDNPPNLDVPYLSGEPIPGLESPDITRILNEHLVSQGKQAGIGINNLTLRVDPFDFGSLSGLHGFFSDPRRAKFVLNPRIVEENGKSYVEYSLSLSFCPQEEGDYVFGPAVFKGTIPAEVDERGQARGIDIFAVGPACTVRVIPPPEEGRPVSYSGAIGRNLVVQASLDTSTCNVGDPLKLGLTVSGSIRLNNMLPPKLSFQTNLLDRFTIYDNTVETIKKDDSRQYIYTLRPTRPGSWKLPPIDVSYYDTRDRTYKTVTTDPIPLHISKASEVTASQIIGNTNGLDAQQKKADAAEAVPAPVRTGPEGAEPGNLIGSSSLIALAGTGPILFAVSLMGQFIRAHRGAWRKTSQRQKAMSNARARLRTAQSIGRSDPGRARAEICSAIRQYLADRFQDSAAGLTPVDVRKKLLNSGVSPQLAETFCSAFEHVFNAGFSNKSQDENVADICKTLRKLIPNIEQDLRNQRIN